MCLIGNASTHWGGKHKEFCFCRIGVGLLRLLRSEFSHSGLKGLIKWQVSTEPVMLQCLIAEIGIKITPFSLPSCSNVSIWQERDIRVGILIHLESSGHPKLSSLIFCLSQWFSQQWNRDSSSYLLLGVLCSAEVFQGPSQLSCRVFHVIVIHIIIIILYHIPSTFWFLSQAVNPWCVLAALSQVLALLPFGLLGWQNSR